mmetsp:Transcript_6508/g.27385  ORF Transcript_6508/g.27385 Transcript_6508/m.27385 type:complete len:238 (+) Transcript_6508:77-790(+)
MTPTNGDNGMTLYVRSSGRFRATPSSEDGVHGPAPPPDRAGRRPVLRRAKRSLTASKTCCITASWRVSSWSLTSSRYTTPSSPTHLRIFGRWMPVSVRPKIFSYFQTRGDAAAGGALADDRASRRACCAAIRTLGSRLMMRGPGAAALEAAAHRFDEALEDPARRLSASWSNRVAKKVWRPPPCFEGRFCSTEKGIFVRDGLASISQVVSTEASSTYAAASSSSPVTRAFASAVARS